MAEGIEIGTDFSELRILAATFGEVPKKVMANVAKAVEVTARHVKDDWRAEAKKDSGKHARGYPYAITYDMKPDIRHGAVEAEIGPVVGKGQGSLGILEDAPGDVRSKPQHAGRDAAKKNEEDFVQGLTIATSEIF